MTTNDENWVEDVRRWYFNGGRTDAVPPARAKLLPQDVRTEFSELGYEAAQPSLQSASWPTPVASGFGTLR